MPTTEQFRALFEPKGVIIAGASTHPGKFGFVTLHNLLAGGYSGRIFATNLEGTDVLGVPTVPSVTDLPENEADLIFLCTPAKANPQILRDAASIGVRAAFITSAGYGEAGEEGQKAQDELVALADELGMLVFDPDEALPGVVVLHPPAQERLEPGVDQRGDVAPVLEHLVVVVDQRVEQRRVVRAEPREERQVLGAGQHVDRVELDETEAVDDPPEVSPVDPARRAGSVETVGPDGEPARLGGRQRRGGRGGSYGAGHGPGACHGTSGTLRPSAEDVFLKP